MHVGSSCAGRATMFRVHRGGRRPSREPGTWRGKKSLTFEVNTALRFHSTHPATFPAIGRRMFFKSLTYLGPTPKALRSHPRGCGEEYAGRVTRRMKVRPVNSRAGKENGKPPWCSALP